MVRIFFCLLGLYGSLAGHCQNKKLSPGKLLPKIAPAHLYNGGGKTLSVADYKGQWIILDFWNKWCGSCIEAFPKMEKLQEEFPGKIKVLLVTNDTDEALDKLFQKVKSPALPILSNDKDLTALFPHLTVPHHAWIDPAGKVRFITGGYNATATNVKNLLAGKTLRFADKEEFTDINKNIPLFLDPRLKDSINSYSFAFRDIPGLGGSTTEYFGDRKNKMNEGFRFIRQSLLDLYKVAFGYSWQNSGSEFYLRNRIQFDLAGGTKFFDYPVETDSIPAWEKRNLVCYESRWSAVKDSLGYKYLQEDLNRYFPFKVSVNNSSTDCYVLEQINEVSNAASNLLDKKYEQTDSLFRLTNYPASSLLFALNRLPLFEKIPVLGGVGMNTKINLTLSNAFYSIDRLQNELLKNGFRLKAARRVLRMLVIADK
ncbi:MAG: hypothetical protein JWQ27_258 [Ferruginibacter sp.]|nr:hypothetical protein [Ferruginibacter sp.]